MEEDKRRESLYKTKGKDKYMYALVEILGKQYKAEEGAVLLVDRLPLEAGASYVIDKVLATVGEEVKGDKVKVYKFRRRKGYRRTQGHREKYTKITINKIEG